MTTELTDFDQQPAGRPVFLTILCIITFLYSTYSLISSVSSYMYADKAAAEMVAGMEKARTDALSKAKSPEEAAMQQKLMGNFSKGFSAANIRKMNLGNACTALLCLAGALFMWRLRKVGFYAYSAGTLLGIITPFAIFGTENLLGIMMTVLVGFFGIVFLILYAVNLKHMQ